MLLLSLLCLGIVAVHVTVAAVRSPRPTVFLRRVALTAAASFVAEDTCMRLYGFYAYNPRWVPFLDRLPLMVALIWPGVVLSSQELATRLLGEGRRRWVPLVGAVLVVCDASFMEPLAVKAGLWRWFEPGFFGVPPVGVLGWGLFAGAAMALFERNDRQARSGLHDGALLLLAPAFTHLGLLAAWWGALRWFNDPIPGWAAAGAAWTLGLGLTALSLRHRASRLVPLGAMATRVPAALFFFGLLWLHGRSDLPLVVFALAFAPPYLSLCRVSLPPPANQKDPTADQREIR